MNELLTAYLEKEYSECELLDVEEFEGMVTLTLRTNHPSFPRDFEVELTMLELLNWVWVNK